MGMTKRNSLTLFLDIDGVLALSKQWNANPKNYCGVSSYSFSPKCVAALNTILEAADFQIILSSDWKFYYDIHTMQCLFREFGVTGNPIEFTPSFALSVPNYEERRVREINHVIRTKKIDRYLVIDDLDLSAFFLEKKFFKCDTRMGLSQTGVIPKILDKITK
jgi:hypothetical protein